MKLTKVSSILFMLVGVFFIMSMAKPFFNIVAILVVASKILTVIDWPICLVGLSAPSACRL
jgi:hypothetical protein